MRGRTRIGRPRRTAGWTLLELVVTIFILVLALLLSGPLLQAGLRHIAFEQERILEAEATNALKQLRADVTSASGVDTFEDSGYLLPLTLPGNRTITYDLQEDRLRRRLDEPPKKGAERTVLYGVGLFHWTRLPGSGKTALRIELSYLRIRRTGRLAEEGHRVIALQDMHRESLVLTLRGDGGTGW